MVTFRMGLIVEIALGIVLGVILLAVLEGFIVVFANFKDAVGERSPRELSPRAIGFICIAVGIVLLLARFYRVF